MSELMALTQRYLETRQSLGYKLEREARQLPQFVEFLDKCGAEYITAALALKWSQQTPSGKEQQTARRLGRVRQLAKFLSSYDPRTEIPSPELTVKAQSRRKPRYIYSADNVRQLMDACARYRGLNASTYSTLIGLMAVTGIRIGEAIALEREDLDTYRRQLTIRCGKFGKARRLPLALSTCEALVRYSHERDKKHRTPPGNAFFVSLKGHRLFYNNVHYYFHQLIDETGLGSCQPRPRPHDLRHSFAVNTLRRWYAEDQEIESRLPALSTYMGHIDPSSTYWYLTATAELLEHARERMERRKRSNQ